MSRFVDDDQNVNIQLLSAFQTYPTASNCAAQGTYAATAVDNGTIGFPDAGDSLVQTYNNCQKTANGFVYNGTITTTWSAGVGDPYYSSTWITSYQTTYNNYSMALGNKIWNYDGTYTFTSSSDGTSLVLSMTNGNLTSNVFVDTSNDPSNPTYTLSTSSQSSGVSATYTTSPSNVYPSANFSSGTLTIGGTMSHTDCNTCSPMDMSYSIATSLGFDGSGSLIAGDVRISAQDVHSADQSSGGTQFPSFSLARMTTFKYAITGQNSGTLYTDVNNDGVFSLPYLFTVNSLL